MADAVRVEIVNPVLKVGGSGHIIKTQEAVTSLTKLLKSGALVPHEKMIAEHIRLDSLGEKLWYSQTSIPKI